jgi:hypothetical protein
VSWRECGIPRSCEDASRARAHISQETRPICLLRTFRLHFSFHIHLIDHTQEGKRHKEECKKFQTKGPVPESRRASIRLNGKGLFHRPGQPKPTPDPDTIYYTKTRMPHVFDV